MVQILLFSNLNVLYRSHYIAKKMAIFFPAEPHSCTPHHKLHTRCSPVHLVCSKETLARLKMKCHSC